MDVFSGFRNARTESAAAGNKVVAWLILCSAVCTLLIFVLVILVGVGLGIAKLAVGGFYFRHCELQPYLPIYLVVDACVGVVLIFGSMAQIDEKHRHARIFSAVRNIVATFHFAWLICGTVWVADVRGKNYMTGNCLNITGENLTFYQDYTTTRFTNATFPSNATSAVKNQTTANLIVDVMPGSTLSNQGNKNSTLLISTAAGTVGSTTGTTSTTVESRTTATRGTQATTDEIMTPEYEYYDVWYDVSCVTCNVVLTEFTLAVVIVQWCMVAVTVCLIVCALSGVLMAKCVARARPVQKDVRIAQCYKNTFNYRGLQEVFVREKRNQ